MVFFKKCIDLMFMEQAAQYKQRRFSKKGGFRGKRGVFIGDDLFNVDHLFLAFAVIVHMRNLCDLHDNRLAES